MSGNLLDPWTDAALIAAKLVAPSARLILIVGAERWCETCRTLRPLFESLAHRHGDNDVWLWLDLEEHCEFLGDFIPDSLPLLVSYKGLLLTHAVIPNPITESTLTELLAESIRIEHEALPDIRGRLMTADWAR